MDSHLKTVEPDTYFTQTSAHKKTLLRGGRGVSYHSPTVVGHSTHPDRENQTSVDYKQLTDSPAWSTTL